MVMLQILAPPFTPPLPERIDTTDLKHALTIVIIGDGFADLHPSFIRQTVVRIEQRSSIFSHAIA
jgi:hypothetical protein